VLAIEILLKGTALLAVVFGVAAALRGASAATRHLVWAFGLVGLLSLPLLTAVTPWRLEILPALVRFETQTVSEIPSSGDIDRSTRGDATTARGAVADPLTVSGRTEWSVIAGSSSTGAEVLVERPADGTKTPLRSTAMLFLAIWATGAALVAARWLTGAVSLRRCLQTAHPVDGPEWDEPLRRASDRLLLDTPVRLLVSDSVPMPLTAGILRPVVVLPESAHEWSPERRQAVIVHELAHVRRRDALAHALGWAASAIWWFHPMVWAAARHLRAESERACDDLVLRAGTRASSYADHLLDIVCHATSPRAPAPAMPLAQSSEFEGRMLRILSPHARRHGLSALKALGLAVVLAAVALPLAALGTATLEPSGPEPWEVAEDQRSAPRRVVDALLPDEAARIVAEKVLGDPLVEDNTDVIESTDLDADHDTEIWEKSHEDEKSEKDAVSPEEATRIVGALSASLRDRDAEVRKSAAEALGELDDPRAVDALMRALRSDSDAGVRAMAAWALGQIEDPRAVPALGEALRDDSSAEVRAMAATALGEIESPEGVQYLRPALRDSNDTVRANAVMALGEIEDAAAVPALAEALRDANVEIRRNAAWALGEIESPAAVEPLTGALRDGDLDVRRKVVWALGEIEDPRALPALVTALRDADAETRWTAAWAIGEIQPEGSAPAALIDAAGDSSVEVRKNVAWALGEIADPAAVPALRRLIQDANAEVRENAIEALTEIQAPSAYEALVQLLNHEDAEVRKAAAEALGDAEWSE
jgi:HEAT repeat protein/beta-lactamase regulating signal transducer with metallopeptidase domain